MDQLIALIVIAVAIVALVLTIGARNRLLLVEIRLAAIESRLAELAAAGARAAPPPAPEAPEPVTPIVPEPVPEPTPPSVEAAPSAAPIRRRPGFEERFGTRWVVWVGGAALALGGIFLVRYSIEQGLIGPGTRIFFAALLALALVSGGEWTRREERRSVHAAASAHIPSILTAAGTTVAYATVYSAYALYGFLNPAAAFVLLGIVALATLAAALVHGPALAGLGLVGAFVTPLLVASDQPNYWALYLYVAIVTAAAFALARARLWRWLAVTAVALGTLWMLPGIADARGDALTAHAFHAAAGFVLAAAFIVSGLLFGPQAESGKVDGVSSGALAAYLLAAALLVTATHHDGLALGVFALLVAATVAIAWRVEAATAAVPAAAVLCVFVIAHWAVNTRIEHLVAPGGPAAGAAPEPESAIVAPHLWLGAAFAILFGASGYFAQGRSGRAIGPMLWAATAVAAPIAILIALYYRVSGFERSIPFAGLALLIAALFAVATESLAKRDPRPGIAAAAAIFATGSIAALALALTFALEKGWLTVGLALMVPGIAYVGQKRPLPALRFVAAAIAVVLIARIAWDPRIVGADVGLTPIFNWLLYGYGIPAAAFWLAGHLMRARADDVPSRLVDGAAILFTVLLGVLEVRHYMNDGDVFRPSSGLGELALDVAIGLAMAIGLERLRARTRNVVHDVAALAIAALTALAIVFGLWIAENPLVTGEEVGGRFVNLVLLGYGLNAVLITALTLVARGTRPQAYRVAGAVLAVGLALTYLSLEVRTLYHGPVLTIGPTTDAEQYTYSVVWLAFGVAVLLAGIALGSQPARLCSAAIVLITIVKVFLIDLAGLEGVFRALSFIGLGLVLMGIGFLYQRLLFPRRRPAAATPPTG